MPLPRSIQPDVRVSAVADAAHAAARSRAIGTRRWWGLRGITKPSAGLWFYVSRRELVLVAEASAEEHDDHARDGLVAPDQPKGRHTQRCRWALQRPRDAG